MNGLPDVPQEAVRGLAPVRALPDEDPLGAPDVGVALCLSGGGYRAMLFHVGAFWRLNDAGLLGRLERVSSVSGGSITAAQLGMAWGQLDFGEDGVARNLDRALVQPLRRLAGATIDKSGVIRGLLTPGSIGDKLIASYRQHLFGETTLQGLPERPRFVINATNLQSAVLWRFSRPYMRDYRVGEVKDPTVPLAVAVAASAAFPPFLSPVVLEMSSDDFVPGTGMDLQRPPFTTRVILSDGGVYDNLGLETAWKRYQTILVSDGGGHIAPEEGPPRDWARQSLRVLGVIDSQVRSLRKRQLIGSYVARLRTGAYWGIRTDIGNFPVDDPLPCPRASTLRLASVATRLAEMRPLLQEQLINWGFAVCDAALRAHVDSSLARPVDFPYPESGVG